MDTATIPPEHGPWPELIMRSFFVAGAASSTSEKRFYGSWNRLLNTVFPPTTMFEVVPQFPPTTVREAVDFVVLLLIYIDAAPVFIVEVKPPSDIRLASKRQEADDQLRRQLGDLVDDLKIPVLHGVCAFATKMAFYSIDRDTNRMQPGRQTSPDPDIFTDTAPRQWWSDDILEDEGADKFRAVIEEVKEMCSHVAF